MNGEPIKILLIEDNPGDARLIREILAETRRISLYLEQVDRLSAWQVLTWPILLIFLPFYAVWALVKRIS